MSYTTIDYQQMYADKRGTVQDCLDQIHSHDVVGFSGDCNEPVAMLRQLHTIAPRVDDVICFKGRIGTYDFVRNEGMCDHINTAGFFYGPGWYEGHQRKNVSFIPADLCDYGTFISEVKPITVFAAAVSPMDEYGNFCVGLSMMWEREFIKTADRIILEVNPNLPRVAGGLRINIKNVTRLYENDEPVMEFANTVPTADEMKVAQYCRSLMRDGDCIQLGIGSLPNALAAEMMDLHDLGIHTEMYTSAMGEMIRKGVATGERKQIDIGVHIGTFAGGDRALYETLGKIPTCRMAPCSYANNPAIIMQNDNMVSVNTCIEMDLTGQVCSETIGVKQYSGTGGAMDFAYGALHSKGGRGIVAFLSTTKSGISKINCSLTPGAAVSIPRDYVDYIITEYGIAPMRGRSVRKRVENLIAIAHPDHRAELRKQAEALFYI
jgi:acyl-CoA hydrolase